MKLRSWVGQSVQGSFKGGRQLILSNQATGVTMRVQTKHDKATGLPRQNAHGQWSVRTPYSDVVGSSASVVLLCSFAELRNPDAIAHKYVADH